MKYTGPDSAKVIPFGRSGVVYLIPVRYPLFRVGTDL